MSIIVPLIGLVVGVAAAATLVIVGGWAYGRFRDVVRRQRAETHEIARQVADQAQVIGALGLSLRLRTVVEEVEQARGRNRITAAEGDRLLHHLRALGDDVTAGERPY